MQVATSQIFVLCFFSKDVCKIWIWPLLPCSGPEPSTWLQLEKLPELPCRVGVGSIPPWGSNSPLGSCFFPKIFPVKKFQQSAPRAFKTNATNNATASANVTMKGENCTNEGERGKKRKTCNHEVPWTAEGICTTIGTIAMANSTSKRKTLWEMMMYHKSSLGFCARICARICLFRKIAKKYPLWINRWARAPLGAFLACLSIWAHKNSARRLQLLPTRSPFAGTALR